MVRAECKSEVVVVGGEVVGGLRPRCMFVLLKTFRFVQRLAKVALGMRTITSSLCQQYKPRAINKPN